MKKFYCFRADQELPKWMWQSEFKDRESRFKSIGAKITFGVSCIAVRETGKHTKLMPSKIGDDVIQINIKNLFNAKTGGVNGASGVCLFDDENQHLHGEGKVYKLGY